MESKKAKPMNKHNKTGTVIDNRERTGDCWNEVGGGEEKQVRVTESNKLPVPKQMSHSCERYSVANTAHDYLTSLHGDIL